MLLFESLNRITTSLSNYVVRREFATHNNSVSILQQFYNRLSIRKKYIKAIKRGTLIWDKGQVNAYTFFQ